MIFKIIITSIMSAIGVFGINSVFAKDCTGIQSVVDVRVDKNYPFFSSAMANHSINITNNGHRIATPSSVFIFDKKTNSWCRNPILDPTGTQKTVLMDCPRYKSTGTIANGSSIKTKDIGSYKVTNSVIKGGKLISVNKLSLLNAAKEKIEITMGSDGVVTVSTQGKVNNSFGNIVFGNKKFPASSMVTNSNPDLKSNATTRTLTSEGQSSLVLAHKGTLSTEVETLGDCSYKAKVIESDQPDENDSKLAKIKDSKGTS